MDILVVGNCQRASVMASAEYFLPGATLSHCHEDDDLGPDLRRKRFDLIIHPGDELPSGLGEVKATERIVMPGLVFAGYHPDMTVIKHDGASIGPLSVCASRLTSFGLFAGLNENQTYLLFRPDVYRALEWRFDREVEALC